MENYRVYRDDWLYIVQRVSRTFNLGFRKVRCWEDVATFRNEAQAIDYAKGQYAKDTEADKAVHGVVWSGEKVDG